ncbi:D-alanyl-D-alanine carboxypeptidase [Roseibium sp. CAU 1637]|uniref:D-alanyl-D-alanine carboxypeptidase n=1 Tax=Roseibium limicola TaxID=2816037 RepID=A0A939EJ83_9HYPH|nr:D-alanyl-D-alanine carboxypeptidase family protein [Roseibium limicola]MBO0343646.1 D-alanyl-D-alanine carboxypeptidase [Roseibium limicola]
MGLDGFGAAPHAERRNGLKVYLRIAVISLASLALVACQSTTGAKPGSPLPASDTHSSVQTPVAQASGVAAIGYAAPALTAETRGYSELVIDMSTGRELLELNADAPRFPASLTKMMTLYLLFEEVNSGRLSMSSALAVSAHAQSQPPAKLGLKAGDTITVEQAARAMAVKSANDVAVVVAEAISGSEGAFARKMTAKAQALGMRSTRFKNASGLPDAGHVSTARDMARLGLALKRRFPQYSAFYRARSFEFEGRTFEATNNLIGRVAGVDGLKTGYIRLAGYNLVATANRGGRRRLVVVMGGSSEKVRDDRVTALLDEAL